MPELLLNMHMHTRYSDGTGSHDDIVQAASRAGLDAVLITDHNLLVQKIEGFRQVNSQRLMMLVGEEIHNMARSPQKSHLLVYGMNRELAPFASDIQHLLDLIQQARGLSFLAHPNEAALPLFGETDISWDDWQVHGYTGLELWNGFSELKSVIHSRLSALFYALFPQYVARGPHPETLRRWDSLLATQRDKVVAIGGSDAHALHLSMGPLRRVVYPYEYHFRAVNTHVLVDNELSGDFYNDRQTMMEALRQGHAFVGYDLPASTRGFRFTAQTRDMTCSMGDDVHLVDGVTFQIRLPLKVECRILRDGQLLKTWTNHEICTHIANQPGVYRVECYIEFLGRKRGWIFSNPIYVRG